MKKALIALTALLLIVISYDEYAFHQKLASIDTSVGVSLPSATAVFETSLQAPITSSATTLTLTANSVRGGSTLSGYQCFTIDEGSAQAEFVCGTISGTTVSSLTRGVDPVTGTSTNATLQFSHRRGANVKITDFPVIQIMRNLLNGGESFPNILRYATNPTLTGDLLALANVQYVNGVANQGAATSTESNAGIAEIATLAEQASGTPWGVDEPHVLASENATSSPTGTSGALHTVIAEVTGKISQVWLDIFGTPNTWTGLQTLSGGFTSSATSTLADLTIGTNSVALTASTTITGGTTPQPIYIATSTNANAGGVLLADGNDINAVDFAGFAVTNATAGQTVYVQKDGVVNGFTGLTKGATYYVSDTVGTLATTTGTYEVKVGIAISTTEILVQRGYDEYIGSAAFDSGSHTTESAVSTTTVPVNAKKVVVELGHRSGSTHTSYTQFVVYRYGVTSGTAKDYRDITSDIYNLTSYSWSGNNLVLTTPIESTSAKNSGTVYFYK